MTTSTENWDFSHAPVLADLSKGDKPGHPFRGNQWSKIDGGGKKKPHASPTHTDLTSKNHADTLAERALHATSAGAHKALAKAHHKAAMAHMEKAKKAAGIKHLHHREVYHRVMANLHERAANAHNVAAGGGVDKSSFAASRSRHAAHKTH